MPVELEFDLIRQTLVPGEDRTVLALRGKQCRRAMEMIRDGSLTCDDLGRAIEIARGHETAALPPRTGDQAILLLEIAIGRAAGGNGCGSTVRFGGLL